MLQDVGAKYEVEDTVFERQPLSLGDRQPNVMEAPPNTVICGIDCEHTVAALL
jgi:hypothetical protein